MMHRLLSGVLADVHMDWVEAAWHRNGPPEDVADRILAVREAPNEWQSLLLPDESK